MLDPQTGVLLLGIFSALVLLFAWSIGHRSGAKSGFDTGYKEGYHDRQHWETDEIVKARLWYGEKHP